MAAAAKRRVPKKPKTRRRKSSERLPQSRGTGPQETALADVARVLKRLDAPSAVIGGVAVIAWGHARLTADIDCAIAAPTSQVASILRTFERGGFEARDKDPIGFAEENLVLLLRHRATLVEVDVSLAQLEFELRALSSAVVRKFGKVKFRVPQVTDLLIYKLVAGRPKDLQDASELLALGLDVDAERVSATLAEFDALLDTDRLSEWQRLLK